MVSVVAYDSDQNLGGGNSRIVWFLDDHTISAFWTVDRLAVANVTVISVVQMIPDQNLGRCHSRVVGITLSVPRGGSFVSQ